MNLRTRLTLWMLAGGLLPAVLLSFGALAGAQYAEDQKRRELRSVGVAVLDKIDRNLFERYGDAQAFAANPVLQDRANWYKTSGPIVEAANRYVALYGMYPLMRVVDLEGRVIAANDKDAAGRPLPVEALYGKSYQGATWLESVKSRRFLNGANGLTGTVVEDAAVDADASSFGRAKGRVITFAAPVYGPDGKMIAVWVNQADFGLVEEILTAAVGELRESGLPSARIELASSKGAVLARFGEPDQAGAVMEARAYAKGALGYPGLSWALRVRVPEEEAIGMVTALRRRVVLVDALVLVVILGMAWFAGRQVAEPLAAAVDRLRHTAAGLEGSSSEFATVAGSLSSTATDQAASIEQTSAAMQGMSGLIRTNQRNSETGREQMRHAHSAVEESFANLRALESAIQSMRDTVAQASTVVRSIEQVAFQTGILSLNAAVEAARAGEAGAGFGVVAEEVRHLADRAAKAALETRELIERTIHASEQTDDGFEKLSGAFGRIQQSTSSMLAMIESAAKGTSEQAEGLGQIKVALQRMENEAHQTSMNADRSSSAGEELTRLAAGNRGVVAELEALLSGGRH